MKIKKKINSPFYKGLSFNRKIKYAIQRIKYGYCDADLWNIKYWFLSILPEMLNELSYRGVGYPPYLTQDEWRSKIRRMASYFKSAGEDESNKLKEIREKLDSYRFSYYKKYGNPIDRLDKLVREGQKYQSITEDKEYSRLLKLYNNELKNMEIYRSTMLEAGMNLFIEYFDDLQD